jgi:hypothetical protein
MEGRRFGAISVGYDRIQTVREEHGTLLGLAAVLTGLPAEKITVQVVQALTSDLQIRMARQAGTGTLAERVAALPENSPHTEVIACALATAHPIPAPA